MRKCALLSYLTTLQKKTNKNQKTNKNPKTNKKNQHSKCFQFVNSSIGVDALLKITGPKGKQQNILKSQRCKRMELKPPVLFVDGIHTTNRFLLHSFYFDILRWLCFVLLFRHVTFHCLTS